jgi:RNA polymerase sigma-70 factor, ECF subfamily
LSQTLPDRHENNIPSPDCGAMSDSDLARQVQNQQAWAFDVLFERHAGAIRRHLLYIVRDEQAAEDLLQEVFLRVWTRAEQWNGQGAFRGWLFRIATNAALNHLRSQRRRPQQPLEVPEDLDGNESSDTPAWLVDNASLGPAETLEASEQSSRLQQIIHDLPEDKREVFHLVHQLEMSLREAADELGIPEGTAKSRLHYARARLSRQWQEWQAEQE